MRIFSSSLGFLFLLLPLRRRCNRFRCLCCCVPPPADFVWPWFLPVRLRRRGIWRRLLKAASLDPWMTKTSFRCHGDPKSQKISCFLLFLLLLHFLFVHATKVPSLNSASRQKTFLTERRKRNPDRRRNSSQPNIRSRIRCSRSWSESECPEAELRAEEEEHERRIWGR